MYEGLLSYTGFFAEEDLYEVHRAGETPDELQNAWFVKAADLAKYTNEEKLFDERLGSTRRAPSSTASRAATARSRPRTTPPRSSPAASSSTPSRNC
ncbi:MAG: hypothetical protein IPN03_07645 [Holophagales bacterium]|nr:hypothetical protein [Holophagales bacterium]